MRTSAMICAALMALWIPTTHAGLLEPILDQNGKLDKKDQVLDNGAYADVYPVDVEVGDRLLIEMEGQKKLDTFLALKAPSGEMYENDDNGRANRSMLDMFVEESGTWLVYATTTEARKRGRYHIRVAVDTSGRGAAPTAPTAAGGVMPITPGQTMEGRLEDGDLTLANGEYTDLYSVEVSAGQRLLVDMTSAAVDTYIGVRSPSDNVDGNDDFEGSRGRSVFDAVVEESGTWTIYATSYAAGESGPYQLRVDVSDPVVADDGPQRWSDTLVDGDEQLSSGEFIDKYRITGQAGERWVIDLRSTDFDPFLIFKDAAGQQIENDDFEGAGDRSLLDVTLDASGEHLIGVTTYRAGQSGRYDLSLRRVAPGEVFDTGGGSQEYTGTLDSGDEQLGEGEWFDSYTFEGLPGQRVKIDLRGEFDTYVGLLGPNGFRLENDDGDDARHSFIEAVLTEGGTHRVVVTSYSAGQGGAYTLQIDQQGNEATSSDQPSRDVTTLQPGDVVEGRLEEGDLTLNSGEYQDRYVIDVEAGQGLSVAMRSTDFDPYIGLQMPDGSLLENDDWEGDRSLARIDVTAPTSGRYRVITTSYRPAATGAYAVSAQLGVAAAPAVVPVASREGRIFGVFVGISDYPDDGPGDLDFTAEDARHLFAGMQRVGMRPEDGRLLTDSEATRDNVMTAISEIGGQMSEGDKLVVFYSGHGGRVPTVGPQSADPDGFDETLALYDGEVTDDEVAEAINALEEGTVLLVLDSCFSGGFSKDVISQPGRMGLFSSHEDVTSMVAVKFRAGGYLARFMVEAVGEQRADMDTDGTLTALELSQYLYERYRSDVKSTHKSGAYDDIVMSGRNLGYQQLIVDRGGVGPSQVLFAW